LTRLYYKTTLHFPATVTATNQPNFKSHLWQDPDQNTNDQVQTSQKTKPTRALLPHTKSKPNHTQNQKTSILGKVHVVGGHRHRISSTQIKKIDLKRASEGDQLIIFINALRA